MLSDLFASSITLYLAACAIIILASAVQTSVGFGLGLVSAPILRLIEPDYVPGPMIVAGFVAILGVAYHEAQPSDLHIMKYAIFARLFGIFIGLYALSLLDKDRLTITIAIMVLSFAIIRATGFGFARSQKVLASTGLVAGITGTVAGLGGAPMALVMSHSSEARNFRGPMSVFMAFGTVMTLTALAINGRFGLRELLLGVGLIPPVFIGMKLGRQLTHIVDKGLLRPIVLGLSMTSAIVALISTFAS